VVVLTGVGIPDLATFDLVTNGEEELLLLETSHVLKLDDEAEPIERSSLDRVLEGSRDFGRRRPGIAGESNDDTLVEGDVSNVDDSSKALGVVGECDGDDVEIRVEGLLHWEVRKTEEGDGKAEGKGRSETRLPANAVASREPRKVTH